MSGHICTPACKSTLMVKILIWTKSKSFIHCQKTATTETAKPETHKTCFWEFITLPNLFSYLLSLSLSLSLSHSPRTKRLLNGTVTLKDNAVFGRKRRKHNIRKNSIFSKILIRSTKNWILFIATVPVLWYLAWKEYTKMPKGFFFQKCFSIPSKLQHTIRCAEGRPNTIE